MLTTSRGSSIPAEVPAFASYPPPFSRPMNYVPALHAFSSTSPLVARPRPHSGWMNNLFTSSNGEEEERATRLVSDGFNWYCDPHIEDREKRCLTHSPSDVSDSTAELNAWSDTASAEDQTEEVEEEEVRGGRLRQVSMSAPQLAPVSSIPIPKRLSNDRLLSAGLSFDTLLFGDPKDREAKLLTEISNSGSNCSTKTFHLPANSALGESTRALLGLPEMQVNPTGLLTVQLMLFISGYRVVQQGMKRHCGELACFGHLDVFPLERAQPCNQPWPSMYSCPSEYSVVLSCGEKKWVSWRRFSH
ncbi:unnamed protein product, partial [Chrysoparadoxa australica]